MIIHDQRFLSTSQTPAQQVILSASAYFRRATMLAGVFNRLMGRRYLVWMDSVAFGVGEVVELLWRLKEVLVRLPGRVADQQVITK